MYGGIRKGFGKFESECWSEDLDIFCNVNVVFVVLSIVDLLILFVKFVFQKVVCFLVLFKWEEEFGKLKFEEKIVFDFVLML